MAYTLAKKLIARGAYIRQDMLDKLAAFLLINQITTEQFNELAGMMPEAE